LKKSRFLLPVIPNEPDSQGLLASLTAIGGSLGASVKLPRWTSYGALELLSKVEFAKNLDEAPPFKPEEEFLEETVGYFNSERYWECHETLESVWRPAKGDEKSLVQGIILVCAALVHEQRREPSVALGIYRHALPPISWQERRYYSIDIPSLRGNVERESMDSVQPGMGMA
jgi:hypothetical protein